MVSWLLRVMVCPAMLESKVIVSLATVSVMACRKEPAPLSLLLVTVIVAAFANGGRAALINSIATNRLLKGQKKARV